MNYYRQITKSRDAVDMRLIDIYMMNKASKTFHNFGFENDVLINRKHDKEIGNGGDELD